MADLMAFIAARLDEDEAAARRVEGTWREEAESIGVILVDGEPLIEGHITGLTAHIVRHEPARVLREVEAKRAILALHNRTHECPIGSTVQSAVKGPWLYIASEHVEVAGTEWPCTTLRQFADIWSDHPDYRAEWKP